MLEICILTPRSVKESDSFRVTHIFSQILFLKVIFFASPLKSEIQKSAIQNKSEFQIDFGAPFKQFQAMEIDDTASLASQPSAGEESQVSEVENYHRHHPQVQ